jgi:hypothetical protein
VPKRVESATNAYRAEEDALGSFVAACCETTPDATIGATELLRAFQEFTGDRSVSGKLLATLLTSQGFSSARMTRGPNKGRVAWHGLRLAATE